MKKTVLIIGAGPAGLSSALILARQGFNVIVYEADLEYVGGLSRTVRHNGFKIDIGGHRFFTKELVVKKFWQEILGSDLLVRKRISRIFYKKRFLSYPLKPVELFTKLNPLESSLFVLSYLVSKISFAKKINSFESWVISRFGKRLYYAFFKSYTEKVWGMECKNISSDWAVQRINNLNTGALIKKFFLGLMRIKNEEIKSLIEEFEYPIHGPGMLWEKVSDEIQKLGGKVYFKKEVKYSRMDSNQWSLTFTDGTKSPSGHHLISTIPVKNFLTGMTPAPEPKLLNSLDKFSHRGFLTVAIMYQGKNPFPDNWLYIHDSQVKVARIQNYGNWSEQMVPSSNHVCLGMEYFCQQGDSFWRMSDKSIFELALEELKILNLPISTTELDFKVIRSANAYPVYDLEYKQRLEEVKKLVNSFENLHFIGRSGLHRYNNQDHSIKTAMVVCENIICGQKKLDPWLVNQDAEYIEEINCEH